MTSHSDQLTALGFKTCGHSQFIPQFNQRGTEWGLPGIVARDLWLLEDGTVITLGKWADDMLCDQFCEWWAAEVEKSKQPKTTQRGFMFD